MEPTYEISFEVVKGGFVNLVVTRTNGEQVDCWGGCLEKNADLNAPLPCQWEGDTEQTPIDLATMFPAEYAYLKAKFGA